MRPAFSSLLCLGLLTLTSACAGKEADCPDGFARDNDGNCVQLGDDGGDGGGGDGGGDGSGGDGSGGDGGGGDGGGGNGGGGDDGAGVGDPCFAQDDCASGLICIVENSSDDQGICTETCDSWTDCSQSFWECCDINNGTTACIPDNWLTGDEECN